MLQIEVKCPTSKYFLSIISTYKNSASSIFFSILNETKILINSAPSGINILLDKKSTASKIFFPKIVISLHTPNDNADGIPTKKMPKPISHDNFVLFSCSPFANAETTVSSRENADVNVANVNSARNTVKKNPPNGI